MYITQFLNLTTSWKCVHTHWIGGYLGSTANFKLLRKEKSVPPEY